VRRERAVTHKEYNYVLRARSLARSPTNRDGGISSICKATRQLNGVPATCLMHFIGPDAKVSQRTRRAAGEPPSCDNDLLNVAQATNKPAGRLHAFSKSNAQLYKKIQPAPS
jgi:hypothetical protein